jgi:hypothetical protein
MQHTLNKKKEYKFLFLKKRNKHQYINNQHFKTNTTNTKAAIKRLEFDNFQQKTTQKSN